MPIKSLITFLLHLMKLIHLLLLFLLAISASALNSNDVEFFLDGVIQNVMFQHGIYAATVSVVEAGSIILKKGYGQQKYQTPTDPDTSLFRPGSVSKLFTFTAIMQLVDQEIISLDDPITKHLPFQLPTKILFAKSSEPIRVRHLMTHTPGLEDLARGLIVFQENKLVSLKKLLENFPKRVYPVDTAISYSNFGVAMLGLIVEEKSSKSFETFIKDHIFDPLEMNHSTFEQPLPEDLMDYMTQVPRLYGNTWVNAPFELLNGGPAGSMSSTSSDMANFMILHLQNGVFKGNRLLSESTMEKFHQRAFSMHPDLNGMALGFWENTINNKRVISHGGNTLLFHSGLYLVKDYNVGLFISFNGGTGGDHRVVFQMFMDRFFPHAEDPRVPICNKKHSSKFAGEYLLLRSSFSDVLRLFSMFSRVHVLVSVDGCLNIGGVLLTPSSPDSNVFLRIHTNSTANPLSSFNKVAFVEAPDGRWLLGSESAHTYVRVRFFESAFVFKMVFFLFTVSLICSVFIISRAQVDKRSESVTLSPLHFTGVVVEQNSSSHELVAKKSSGLYENLRKTNTIQAVIVLYAGSFFVYAISAFLGLFSVDSFFGLPIIVFGETSILLLFSYVFVYVFLLEFVVLLAYCGFAWWAKLWSLNARIALSSTCFFSLLMFFILSYLHLL
ncbi:hypothetical protein RCL1_001360 [Eukaryota sp. TZLM3-RCL]